MPQFRSLPSIESSVAEVEEESKARYASYTPVTSSLLPTQYGGQPEQHYPNTSSLPPISQSLHDVPTTQSLIQALQAATYTPRKTDQLIVIPGSDKRTRLLPESQTAQTPPRRMRRRVRHGIALGAIAFVMLLTMLTLAPLDGGQSTFHAFNGVAKWASGQQQNWDILSHTDTTNSMPTVPPIATVAGNPPSITLPTSQYVAIARQDAINAGIPPDYFVRQIYAESGFDPNASSPAGAVGIAQFEPGTAAGLGINPYDPIQSLSGAARLMSSYAIQYNGDYAKALAAYNAGGGNLDYAVRTCGANWLNCVPAETQNYIYKIMGI